MGRGEVSLFGREYRGCNPLCMGTMTGMPVASSQYWNMVYGGSAEEVAQDAEGLQTMRTLGRNMAFMMKSFQLGKEQIGLPQKEPLIFTNFHR